MNNLAGCSSLCGTTTLGFLTAYHFVINHHLQNAGSFCGKMSISKCLFTYSGRAWFFLFSLSVHVCAQTLTYHNSSMVPSCPLSDGVVFLQSTVAEGVFSYLTVEWSGLRGQWNLKGSISGLCFHCGFRFVFT